MEMVPIPAHHTAHDRLCRVSLHLLHLHLLHLLMLRLHPVQSGTV